MGISFKDGVSFTVCSFAILNFLSPISPEQNYPLPPVSPNSFSYLNNDVYIFNPIKKPSTESMIIQSHFEQRIRQLSFPVEWHKEGIERPNDKCASLSLKVCMDIFSEYKQLPSKIAPSKEGGLFFTYIHSANKTRELFIEIYNDLAIAALVNDNKKIVTSVDVGREDFSKIISIFNELS